ncbi:MAG: hypothetical protein K1X36_13785 [Pyrinomonadaceae bacterium]|nr:hypothetical protein [Pyrinomonadaceae bacterium]
MKIEYSPFCRQIVLAMAVAAFMVGFAAVAVWGQLTIQAIDVAGDSISKGFNASSSFPCSNGDQENFNWITSHTNGSSFCSTGNEGVFSIAERIECDLGAAIFSANPNHAQSGATLVSDFVNQSAGVKSYLQAQSVQRMAVVFLGHNDNCSGTITKVNTSCSSSDLDPQNYCKTRPDSFERELRKGLDQLISIGNTRVGVVAPVRVSQLCNFGAKSNCQLLGSCQFLWGTVNICGALTRDCSATRISDTYTTMRSYREILKRVTTEYEAIPIGGTSPVVLIGGQSVGGGIKALGTTVVYSDAPWFYRFKSEQISCCDCFHPSALGQDALAKLLKDGLSCSKFSPCCKDTDDPLADGKCSFNDRKRTYYRGVF